MTGKEFKEYIKQKIKDDEKIDYYKIEIKINTNIIDFGNKIINEKKVLLMKNNILK